LSHRLGSKSISVTSGKGGVGKTVTTVNLAFAMRRMDLSVLIIDGDFGLANVDVILGLKPRYSIQDVLNGHAELQNIIVEGPNGINIIPSGSGISALCHLSKVQKYNLMEQIENLRESYDIVIVDTGAGINETVLQFNQVVALNLVVTTPEPHALTDAYALIKVLSEKNIRDSYHLLVNQVKSKDEGLKVFERVADVAMRFLNIKIHYAGHVPYDPQVPKSIMQRRAVSNESINTIAGQAWNQLAGELLNETQGGRNFDKNDEGVRRIWRELMWSENTEVKDNRVASAIG
jgi:flagellar biosynthesis protein FlhG